MITANEELDIILGPNRNKAIDFKQDIALLSGVPAIDYIFTAIPSGVLSIYGAPSVGKTFLGGTLLKAAQQQQKETYYFPTELEEYGYLKEIGVDLNKLGVLTGDTKIEKLISLMLQTNTIILVDSFTSISHDPNIKKLLIKEAGDIPPTSCVIFISQVTYHRFKRKRTVSVEAAYEKYFTSVWEMVRTFSDDQYYTATITARQHPLPLKRSSTTINIDRKDGITISQGLFDLALELNIIERRGPFYFVDDINIGQGVIDAVKNISNTELLQYKLQLLLNGVLKC